MIDIKLHDIKNYIIEHWTLLVGFAVALSGAIALLRNLFQIRNLRLQNKKLSEEYQTDESLAGNTAEQSYRYKKALSGLNIEYASVARNSLDLFPLSKNQFLDLLSIEFKSHPLFALIDYESLPLPLKGGYFAILTKSGKKITLETITKSTVKKELFEAWSELARLYFQAYRLPFRSNHHVLTSEKEFERSFKLLNQLIVTAQKYILQTQVIDDENVRMACHALKTQAAAASGIAEIQYFKYKNSNDSSLLGNVAIQLDVIISAIHKILVEYNVPK